MVSGAMEMVRRNGLVAAAMPPGRKLGAGLALAVGYVALYLLVDRLTFIQALHGIDITPWNPPPGLTLALLIVKGRRYFAAVVVAALLSNMLLPLVPVPPAAALAAALVTAGGYAAAAALLCHGFRIDPRLHRARDLVLLMVVASFAAAAVALGLVTVYAAAELVPWRGFAEAAFQLWIGDAIGVIVLTPLLLVLVQRVPQLPSVDQPRAWLRWLEAAAQIVSVVVAFAIVFGFGHDRYAFELFYLLFLPLIWIATRRGLAGASLAVFAVQAGLIIALELLDQSAATIRTFQLVMFTLATTSLMLGAVVGERHRVARALAESQNRLAAILNTARDGVLMIDVRGRIESVNPAVERLFARPASFLIGHDVRNLLEAPDLLPDLARIALPAAGEPASRELNARRGDGGSFPIELTVGRFGRAGEAHYTLVVRDITARRATEARAREHESELAHVSRLLLAGEMASALAHEINQPLTAIAAYGRGCLRLLAQAPPEPTLVQEGVEQVIQQAERAGDIIGRLREFMRTGACQRSVVAVAALVESAIALTQLDATQNGIDLRARVPGSLPPVLADRIQIEQVLVNLLRNGMEAILGACSERRVVTVEARCATERSVEIRVADTGQGVSQAVAAQLFEPFVTTKANGMGLGLAISRSIIEAHDGRLRFIRPDAGGAVFAFDLPAARGGAA